MKKIALCVAVIIGSLNSVAQKSIVDANNDFAFRIYNATRPEEDNFFISPFSLSIALGVVNEGAATTTRTEMDSLLSTVSITNKPHAYAELLRKTLDTHRGETCLQYPENKKAKNKLLLANSLWIRDDAEAKDSYREVVEEYYQSKVFSFSKDDLSGTNQRLNSWLIKKTNGRISGIELSQDARLSIVNAIYFMGEWQDPFEKRKTKEKNFHTFSKKKVKMDFLNKQSFFNYYENAEIQSVYIPYNCDEFSMVILLPKERYGITALEKNLTAEYFARIDSAHACEVILSIPKFKIESEVRPRNDIEAMGYTQMFSNHADFSGMSTTNLTIGNIIHKTFIEVSEDRTEAAAVTEVELVVVAGTGGEKIDPPLPKIFNANHPFVFLIVDNRSKAILFMGRFAGESTSKAINP